MSLSLLPPSDPQRAVLHNEVHARPSALLAVPAWIVTVAVLNAGVSREQEWAHLRQLPGLADLALETLHSNFARLPLPGGSLKWERHSEFTRYSWLREAPASAHIDALPQLPDDLALQGTAVSAAWLQSIPGQTLAAISLLMVPGELPPTPAQVSQAQEWLHCKQTLASLMGMGLSGRAHSWMMTGLEIETNGFERMLVVVPEGTTPGRAGRIAQRLLELEIYRLMALRGLPVAKQLGPELGACEAELAHITAQLQGKASSDQELLDALVTLAVRIENATALHSYRFSATRAYQDVMTQRMEHMRERPIPGLMPLGEFLRRRVTPAMHTVAATAQRLESLSQRVTRASDLLRTQVDIETEAQNQQLLEKLNRGQQLQLRLQSTVEGLSIAAISYYVVSLLHYAGKALKNLGLPVQPELLAGASIPFVLWAVWTITRRIHHKLWKE